MASIYKRYRRQNKSGTWYIQYFDEHGKRRTVRGCTDKDATMQIARKLEADVALRKAGVIDARADRYAQEGHRPIAEHLKDWRQDLFSRGVSEKHVRLAFGRVARAMDLAGIHFLRDVTPSAVQNAIVKLRDTGRAAKTLNDTLASVKQFCNWARRDGRLAENSIEHLRGFNTAIDRRHDRRALSDEEIRQLFAAAARGPTLQGCPGAERALIYRLAVLTGLRANEIRTLRKKSFDLDCKPPTVTVQAAFSKHRRQDVQPLAGELVACLRAHLAGKKDEEIAFRMPKSPVEALRRDLENAAIEYKTHRGFADFHALRHTFITRLIRAGVNPKTAQTLARHHDASLTLNVYSHVELIDQVEALKSVPRLDRQETQHTARGLFPQVKGGSGIRGEHAQGVGCYAA